MKDEITNICVEEVNNNPNLMKKLNGLGAFMIETHSFLSKEIERELYLNLLVVDKLKKVKNER